MRLCLFDEILAQMKTLIQISLIAYSQTHDDKFAPRAHTHVNDTNLLTLYQAGSGTHDGMFIKPTYAPLGPPPRHKTFEQVLQLPCIQNRLSNFAEPVIVIHENL
jgi:hypothetical protein